MLAELDQLSRGKVVATPTVMFASYYVRRRRVLIRVLVQHLVLMRVRLLADASTWNSNGTDVTADLGGGYSAALAAYYVFLHKYFR